MRRLWLIVLSVIMICFTGCTFHFKATDLEMDAERQRVQSNATYELEKVVFLHEQAD